jgi:hypothetical protein
MSVTFLKIHTNIPWWYKSLVLFIAYFVPEIILFPSKDMLIYWKFSGEMQKLKSNSNDMLDLIEIEVHTEKL